LFTLLPLVACWRYEPREHLRPLAIARAAIPPSPLGDRVGYSDHVRFRGYVPVHCRSGLQPPCLRFATAVTGRHARLGSRLLAGLCRGRHRRRQTSTRLQGATPTPPYVRVRIRRFAGLSGNSCSIDAVIWMSAIVAPASTPLISASQGFTPSRRSEAGCPEFSRMTDAISLHLLVTSSVQAFSETRSAYYALC
jgi:hypothetical protein